MNRGLPPSLASTDPSLNYHAKGIDIATAAYVSELGYLASPVSTHIQSAEMVRVLNIFRGLWHLIFSS